MQQIQRNTVCDRHKQHLKEFLRVCPSHRNRFRATETYFELWSERRNTILLKEEVRALVTSEDVTEEP